MRKENDLSWGLREGFLEEVPLLTHKEGLRVNHLWNSTQLGNLEEVKEVHGARGRKKGERGDKSLWPWPGL